jgi:hypothetical protein
MYLYQVLQKYEVDRSVQVNTKVTFQQHIKNWAGPKLLDFDFSGSSAKGTEVNCSSDIDFFISLCSSTPDKLQNIYDTLFNKLNSFTDVQARKQNVSIGCEWNGLKIDFTPGKKRSGNTGYHSLYKNKTGGWTQTNIQKHINVVKGSQRENEIKLTKIWRYNHNLEFPSTYLELFVIRALKYKNQGNLDNNFYSVLEELANNINNYRIEDPSNTGNVLSDDLSDSEKLLIKYAAQNSIGKRNWNNIVW